MGPYPEPHKSILQLYLSPFAKKFGPKSGLGFPHLGPDLDPPETLSVRFNRKRVEPEE